MPTTRAVVAAFAGQRDAGYAMQLIASMGEAGLRPRSHEVIGERGDVQMIVIEVEPASDSLAERVETLMTGAHGVLMAPPAEARQLALVG